MFTFVVFIASLLLLVFLFLMKAREISTGRKVFLEDWFERNDAFISKILSKIKLSYNHLNFENIRRFTWWLVAQLKQLAISLKRRFDHKQSHFFAKRDHSSRSKGSVSFFLKNVSEYKKTLREEGLGQDQVKRD